jgi:hypothetical protein
MMELIWNWICAVSAFFGSYVVYVVDLDGLISVIDFIII